MLSDSQVFDVADEAIRVHGAKQKPSELFGFLKWLRGVGRELDAVVEVGVRSGGNMWAMQQVVPAQVRFVGVDLNTKELCAPIRRNTVMIVDRSSDAAPVARALYVPARSLVYIDADHKYQSVCDDTYNYPARYQVYHDIVNTRTGQGVPRFFKKYEPSFTNCWVDGGIGIGVRVPGIGEEIDGGAGTRAANNE